MALLTCSDVTFSYEGIPVLTDVNFALEAGSYLCIVGENGSGKSTLVKGLLHLKNPSTGSITTGDGLHPSEIGYLPQQTAAQKDFPASVWEVVLSGRQNHPHFPPFYTKADKEDALRNMELLDLLPLKKRCYRDLSGGQQQRVLLARALCATKKLLLLDEPVTGLDPVMTNEMYQLIRRINREQNVTIIMVSHDIRNILPDATHILQLDQKQVFFGPMDEYLKTEAGKQFLGGADLFMQRALVVGILVSLCAALLGVSLVLKRYSMIGDGLSHVGFGSLAIAAALGFAPLAFTIPVVVLAAFLLLRMNESSKIKGDAAIGLISSSALAIGVITVSWSSGMNTDVNNYMFGSILAMSDEDVVLSVVLSIVVLILFVLYYNRIFAVTFDETFAKATGVRAEVYNMLLAFLTAITTVLGMRMMGALLISSLLIFPALTSMRLCHTFQSVVICSAVLSVVCFLLGMSLSFFLSSPAGATVVIVNLLAFLIFSAIARIREHTA